MKRLLTILPLLLCSFQNRLVYPAPVTGWVMLQSWSAGGVASGTQKIAINTEGCNFILVVLDADSISSVSASPSVSDVFGNTWNVVSPTGFTSGFVFSTASTNNYGVKAFYMYNGALIDPVRGYLDTITFQNITAISVSKWIRPAITANPLDQKIATVTSGTSSAAAGNLTPTNNNELSIAACNIYSNTGWTVPSGYTLLTGLPFASGLNYGFVVSSKVLSSTSTINPSTAYTPSSINAPVMNFTFNATN